MRLMLSVATAKAEMPPEEFTALTVGGGTQIEGGGVDHPTDVLLNSYSTDAPLVFERKQQNLTVPPAVYLSREYVWGPGDNGVDELLCQRAWPSRDVPWWVISNVSGDCVAMVTQATVGTPSRVAWQGAYDAYGQVIASRSIVSHPPLRAGHKGLFAERLDGGVAWLTGTPTLGDLDRGRLEPPATIVYHNRNRTLSPGLGRFLQSDPNASGVGLVSSVAHSGRRVLVDVISADLGKLTGDGVSLYQYCRSDPIGGGDPTGLYDGTDALQDTFDIVGMLDPIPGPSDYIRESLKALVEDYSANLSFDVEWAMNWDLPDDDHSRTDDSWVTLALGRGLYNAFDIDLSFTDASLNPLDAFASNKGGGDLGKTGGSGRVRTGHTIAAQTGQRAHKNYRHTLGGRYEFEQTIGQYRVDAIDRDAKIVRELKPDTPSGRAKGARQLAQYLKVLGPEYTGYLDFYKP